MVPRRSPLHNRRNGVSLAEALLSVVITTLAGSALLTAIGTSLSTTVNSVHLRLAQGLCAQLLDEISAVPFPDASSTSPPTGTPREDFNDLDDFDGWSACPPQSRFGLPLGSENYTTIGPRSARSESLNAGTDLLDRFRRRVTVEPVDQDTGGVWQPAPSSDAHRRVTVIVDYMQPDGSFRELLSLTEIVSLIE